MLLNLRFHPFPNLETPRLLLRKQTTEDAQDLYTLRSDDGVMQFLDRPKPASVDEIRSLISKILADLHDNNSINWAITRKGENRLIGTIGFWRIEKEHFRAEIGYMLLPAFQGQGLMQEAISAVIDYGFNIMNLHSVEANCNPGNHASIRLLEKNKFVREAYFRENYYYAGKFLDSVIYSLVKTPGPH